MNQHPPRRPNLLPALLLILTSIGTGAARAQQGNPPAPTLAGDPAHPAATEGWIETQLFFGLGPIGHTENQRAWQTFLDREVTPRFPAGLSVVEVYGQWKGVHETRPARISSRLLILVYPATPGNAASIDAIRSAWKQRTGDQSVLKVTRPVDVSF